MGRLPWLVVAILATTVAALAAGAEWHVAPGGSDAASGSTDAPLGTVTEALERAVPGDRVLLARGGTYPATDLTVAGGITVSGYGRGEQPVLTASIAVDLPGIWGADPAVRTGTIAARVVACYVDGRFVRLARYPDADAGFLRTDNDNEYDRIVDAELAARPGVAPGRWTGAMVRWRKWSWWWETRPVADHPAVDTLELDPAGAVGINLSDPGSGYFIDSDLDELDAPGEWMWQDGTLYLYPPAWADPGTMEVTVVTTTSTALLVDHDAEPVGVSSNGASFSDLHFTRYYGTALALNGPSTVDGCTFSELESVAIRYTWNAQPFTVQRSLFRDVRNIALRGWADPAGPAGSLVERNLFLRIGAEPGYGGNGPWHAAGVIIGLANAAVVRLNRFVDTGYAGIILGSDGQTVERNVFVRAMETLNDGAAVYTNCNASVIRDNIILDTIGDLEYSHPWWPLGHGIWLEFLEQFHDSVVTDNTIYGSNGHGIFLPNNYHCQIRDNTVLDNRLAGLGLYRANDDPGFDPDQDHVITGNLLAAVAPTRRLQRPENLNQWWLPPYSEPVPVALEYETTVDYGTMSHTTFVAPPAAAGVIRVEPWGGGASQLLDSLSAWTAIAPWADATGSRIVRQHAILLFNDSEEDAVIAVPPGTWTLPDGGAVGATVGLAPFRSAVLVSPAPPPATPPYVAASGIDWRATEPVTTYLGGETEILRDGFESGDLAGWSASLP